MERLKLKKISTYKEDISGRKFFTPEKVGYFSSFKYEYSSSFIFDYRKGFVPGLTS